LQRRIADNTMSSVFSSYDLAIKYLQKHLNNRSHVSNVDKEEILAIKWRRTIFKNVVSLHYTDKNDNVHCTYRVKADFSLWMAETGRDGLSQASEGQCQIASDELITAVGE